MSFWLWPGNLWSQARPRAWYAEAVRLRRRILRDLQKHAESTRLHRLRCLRYLESQQGQRCQRSQRSQRGFQSPR